MIDFEQVKLQLIELSQANSDIEVLWLYGSYAKGTAHSGSDIDLAVAFKGWQKDPIQRRLRSELIAIDWQQALSLKEGAISVLDMSSENIPLTMSVLKTGKLLLSKNRYLQLTIQQRIMSKWEIDFLYHYENKGSIYG